MWKWMILFVYTSISFVDQWKVKINDWWLYNVWYQYINFNMAGYHTVFRRSYLLQTIMLSCLVSMLAYPTCSPGCLYYWQADHPRMYAVGTCTEAIRPDSEFLEPSRMHHLSGLCESLLVSINKCNGMGWKGISDICVFFVTHFFTTGTTWSL